MLRTAMKLPFHHLALLSLGLALLGGCDSPVDPPEQPEPASVQVLAPDSLLRVERTMQLTAEVRDAKGAVISGAGVAWSSSDPARATVSETGVVTGLTRGTVTVTASRGEVSGSARLRIHTPVTYVSLQMGSRVLPVGGTLPVRVVVKDSAYREIQGLKVTLHVQNPEVLALTDSVARGLSPGATVVTAVVEGVFHSLPAYVVRGYTVTPLGTLGGAESRAFGLNERGNVVGQAQTASGAWRAVLWRNGQAADLGAPGGWSRAVAVNDSGAVVGIFRPTADSTGASRPFLWREGTVTALAPSSDADHVYATGINNRGEVVGYSTTLCPNCDGGTAGSAFLWQNGVSKDLGRFGGHQGIATDVDDRGRIVGGVRPQDRALLVEGDSARTLFPGVAAAISGGGHVAGGMYEHYHLWKDGSLQTFSVGRRTSARVHGVSARGEVLVTTTYSYPASPIEQSIVVHQPEGYYLSLNPMLEPGSRWSVTGVGAMSDRGEIVGWGKDPDTGATRALLLRPRP